MELPDPSEKNGERIYRENESGYIETKVPQAHLDETQMPTKKAPFTFTNLNFLK